jgi:predicted AAA+ superfamily ATPase
MEIQEKIRAGQRRILERKLFPRKKPAGHLLDMKKIITFLGGRRTGKTSLMIEIVQWYLRDWQKKIDDVVFLDFSELDNHRINLEEIYTSFAPRKPFFILDEVQELPDFESQVLFLYNEGCDVFLSGSNSHLLGQEIATKLRGRSFEVYNDVLSFEEFLIFREKEHLEDGLEKEMLLDEYIEWGGYPEVILQNREDAKRSLLQSYLDVTIYRDLIDRYRIRNPEILSSLIRSLCIGNTKPLNINKLYNTYKSLGYSVSKNTLYEYLGYLEENFFISHLENFYRKSYFDKVYLLDNGYMNLFSSEKNQGQKFENMVYKMLRKSQKKLGYIDDPYEVDFTDGERHIQVTYELGEENLDRETMFRKMNGTKILVARNFGWFERIDGIELRLYNGEYTF